MTVNASKPSFVKSHPVKLYWIHLPLISIARIFTSVLDAEYSQAIWGLAIQSKFLYSRIKRKYIYIYIILIFLIYIYIIK